MKASPYTNPALRDRIKAKITAGTKGGKAGQWSARKAQMVAIEYKKQGGSYTGAKSSAQSSLKKWTGEKWTTRDGKPAIRDNKGKTETRRYLPADAWAKLTPSQAKATDDKKRSASSQFVPNTKKAASARKDDMNDFWTRYDSWRRLGPNQMGKKCGRGWIGLRGACQRAKHHNGDKEATLKASKLALADKIRKRKGMKNRDEPRRKNRRLTADDVNKTPWKFTASQYQYAHKVHEPWIAEASPMQSGLMGKREKRQYQEKRSNEFKASADIKQEWADKVWAAFQSGNVKREELSKDKDGPFSFSALDVVELRERSAKKEDKDKRLLAAREKNRIMNISEIELEDKVYDAMGENALVVKKKNKASVSGVNMQGQTRKIPLGRILWNAPRDLEQMVELGESITPTRKKQDGWAGISRRGS